jgi:hypothetical protein
MFARLCTLGERLDELEGLPHRNAVLHWFAFTLSLLSFILLLTWIPTSSEPVPLIWVWIDIGLGVMFAIEFVTRSGLRWNRRNYLLTHFFDFIAIVPALAFVNYGFVAEGAFVWLILVARFARIVDRFLGDGFVTRNFLALVEGFEEEITDRVIERIIARLQADVDQAHFSKTIAESLDKHKVHILQRVKESTPREGLLPSIARVAGLDAALERAEERAYDAVVKIVGSEEMDHTIRDTINASFASVLDQLGKKTWRQRIGIRVNGNASKKPEIK